MMDAQTDGVVENAAIGLGDLTVVRNMEGSTLTRGEKSRRRRYGMFHRVAS